MKNYPSLSLICWIALLLFSTTLGFSDRPDDAAPPKGVQAEKKELEKKKKEEEKHDSDSMGMGAPAPAPAPSKPGTGTTGTPTDPSGTSPAGGSTAPAAGSSAPASSTSAPAAGSSAPSSSASSPSASATGTTVVNVANQPVVIIGVNPNNQTVNPTGSDTLNGPSVPLQAGVAQTQSNMPSAVAVEIANHLVMVNPKGSLSNQTAFTRAGIPTGALAPRYFLFYYSAHWCPPCRIFTPQFVDFYNKKLTAEQKASLMVVFVSQDHSEKEMFQYMSETKMPWPAIAYAQRQSVRNVNALMGDGIPCLVMVDRDFNVMVSSDHKGKYTPPMKVLEQVQQKLKQNP